MLLAKWASGGLQTFSKWSTCIYCLACLTGQINTVILLMILALRTIHHKRFEKVAIRPSLAFQKYLGQLL